MAGNLIDHRLLLASPTAACRNRRTSSPMPYRCAPGAGEVLLETMYSDRSGHALLDEGRQRLAAAHRLGEVMRGGGIARVLESGSDTFARDDLVQARLGWQTHPTIPARHLQRIDHRLGDVEAGSGPWG